MVTMNGHHFINKHTVVSVLILIAVCFFAGYFVGQETERARTVGQSQTQ